MAASAKATQEFVSVKEVRDGVIVLKDGTFRSVLMASSMNFALKSQDEQQAILLQFQNFLNSLDFSVQIFIQSRELDIRPYLALLEERLVVQTNDLLKIQIREYIDFIKNFTEGANIMTKNFFIVVPYSPSVASIGSGINKVLGKEQKSESQVGFEEHRTQLDQRIAVVEQGMARAGVRVAQLGTEEAIELLYKMFNPGELEKPIQLEQK